MKNTTNLIDVIVEASFVEKSTSQSARLLEHFFSEVRKNCDELNIDGMHELRMLILISHYISASSASHGFTLGYYSIYEQEVYPEIKNNNALRQSFPSSCCISFSELGLLVDFKDTKSEFEKQELTLFEPKVRGPIISLVIGLDKGVGRRTKITEQLKNILIKFPEIIHVVIFGDKDPWLEELLDLPNWNCAFILLGSRRVAIANRVDINFSELLNKYSKYRYDDKTNPLISNVESSKQTLQVIPADKFGGVEKVSKFGSETLNGPKILSYLIPSGLDKFALREIVTPVFNSPSTEILKVSNVFLSGTSIIWREGAALAEALLIHDSDLVKDNKIAINNEFVKSIEISDNRLNEYFIIPTNNTHHSHLMMESIAHLHYLSLFGENFFTVIASDILSTSQREHLEFLLPKNASIKYKKTEETFYLEKAYIISRKGFSYDRKSIGFLQNLASKYSSNNLPKRKLYLSREDSRVYRNLVNESEVSKVFEKNGFEILILSKMTILEKILAFSAASLIAGPLGAGFHYSTFSKSPTLLWLTCPNYFPPFFPDLASVGLNESHIVEGQTLFHQDAWGGGHSSYYIDPRLVQAALNRILQNPGDPPKG